MRMRTRTKPAILVTVTSAVLGVGCHTHDHIVSSIVVRYCSVIRKGSRNFTTQRQPTFWELQPNAF